MVEMKASSGADPQLYRPRPPLVDCIEYFGYWQRDSGDAHQSRALPRGAATIIVDVGGRLRVDFYASDGSTRLDVPPAFIAGAGTASYVTHIDAAQAVITIHFRPAGALPFIGIPFGELENSCVGLTDLWGREATVLHERLIAVRSAAERVALLESFLLHRRQLHVISSHNGVMAVLGAIEEDPSMRVSDARELAGLSPKRLTAAFRAEVSLAPKAYQRVRRLHAALRQLDSAPGGGATIAADLGYFDQAHFVREFRSFTAMTPTQYAQRRSWLPSHVELAAARPTGGTAKISKPTITQAHMINL
jgi:AraC-like DNA-binding protein